MNLVNHQGPRILEKDDVQLVLPDIISQHPGVVVILETWSVLNTKAFNLEHVPGPPSPLKAVWCVTKASLRTALSCSKTSILSSIQLNRASYSVNLSMYSSLRSGVLVFSNSKARMHTPHLLVPVIHLVQHLVECHLPHLLLLENLGCHPVDLSDQMLSLEVRVSLRNSERPPHTCLLLKLLDMVPQGRTNHSSIPPQGKGFWSHLPLEVLYQSLNKQRERQNTPLVTRRCRPAATPKELVLAVVLRLGDLLVSNNGGGPHPVIREQSIHHVGLASPLLAGPLLNLHCCRIGLTNAS
jgi:hypothetical protein